MSLYSLASSVVGIIDEVKNEAKARAGHNWRWLVGMTIAALAV